MYNMNPIRKLPLTEPANPIRRYDRNIGYMPHVVLRRELFGRDIGEAEDFDWGGIFQWEPVVDNDNKIVDIVEKRDGKAGHASFHSNFKITWDEDVKAYRTNDHDVTYDPAKR
jgi:hypothetical protein